MIYDTVIAGAGVGGVCLALFLGQHERVLLIEAERPGAGASGIATGIVNPVSPRKGLPVWGAPEALEVLEQVIGMIDDSPVFRRLPIIQPAMDGNLAEWFMESARRYSPYGRWISPGEMGERFPGIHVPRGALEVLRGGVLDATAFVMSILAKAIDHGVEVINRTEVEGWTEEGEGVRVHLRHSNETWTIQARHLVLALGAGYRKIPDLRRLKLHSVKGQVVRVAGVSLPHGEEGPVIGGSGYIIPDKGTLVIGSSYEHHFSHLQPSRSQTLKILEKARAILPTLNESTILDETAGIRVNVPGTRLPMVGRLPGKERIFVFTAFGSRGLLMAPLLARCFKQFRENPEIIPEEISTRTNGYE